MSSHASHEACELKSGNFTMTHDTAGHASHEACELKFIGMALVGGGIGRHASHEACELKWKSWTIAI